MRPGQHKRIPNHVIGLILVVLIAVGSVLAYTKKLPWSHAYEIKAVFTSAENIRVKSPVRIAGVQVGTVTSVHHCTTNDPECGAVDGGSGTEAATGGSAAQSSNQPPGEQAAIVTMEINDNGRPIKDDATFKLRPRLFLEGNLFVDLQPGTPDSPEASDGHVFPVTQTAESVQLDQVLSTLQSNVRRNLQIFLKEFGDALIKYHGAEGFRTLYQTSPGAYKYTSQVNQALLGTKPHDLSGLVKNLDSTIQALDADQSGLQNLITNLRIVTGAFAARNGALQSAIAELPRTLAVGRPALAALNQAFPPLRAFAREALPGTRSTPETLDAATPLLHQIRKLVSRRELRGLTHDLRPTIPRLTKLSHRSIPFLNQSRALASCFNEVINPWSLDSVPDPDYPSSGGQNAGKVYQETGYGLVGIAGESRSGDANGEYVRVEAGGGANSFATNGGFLVTSQPQTSSSPFFGFAESKLLGARPSVPSGNNPGGNSSAKPPYRPGVPCERQEPPDLNSGSATPEPTGTNTPISAASGLPLPGPLQNLSDQARKLLPDYQKALGLNATGKLAQGAKLLGKTLNRYQRKQKSIQPQLNQELKSLGGTPLGGTSLGGTP